MAKYKKNIIKEVVREKLLETASYNEKVGMLASKYTNDILSIFKKLKQTNQKTYDDVKWGFSTKNTDITTQVAYIDWNPLEKPELYQILLGPFKTFNCNLYITVCIVEPSSPNMTDEYEKKLYGYVNSGEIVVDKFKGSAVLSLACTPQQLQNKTIISTISHELLHLSQIIKKEDNDGFDEYKYTTSEFYLHLRKKLKKSSLDKTIKNNMDILFYILTQTEQNAFLHEIGEDMKSNNNSKTYTMLKKTIKSFLNNSSLFSSFEQYLSFILLNMFGRNKRNLAKKIFNDLINFNKKLDKVYYQHKYNSNKFER